MINSMEKIPVFPNQNVQLTGSIMRTFFFVLNTSCFLSTEQLGFEYTYYHALGGIEGINGCIKPTFFFSKKES